MVIHPLTKNMPTCRHCKKETNGLIVDCRHPYGDYYACKACNTARSKKYSATLQGAERRRSAVYKSVLKFPEKQRARVEVGKAIVRGEIKRPSMCSLCLESKKVEAHHTDYKQPLLVTWLCRSCHSMV